MKTLEELRHERAGALHAEHFRHQRWLYWHGTRDMRKRQEAHDLWVHAQRHRIACDREIAKLLRVITDISTKGVRFVAEFEGGSEFSRDGKSFPPYWDEDGGVWTIGYGHTADDGAPIPNRHTRPLTPAEAATLLHHDLREPRYLGEVLAALRRYGWRANQCQVDALVASVYNLGPAVLDRGRSLGDALAARSITGVVRAELVYVKAANGKVLPGLERRRRCEGRLFANCSYSTE
jgi:GH24 family phage-related lysozyme (muramidase)